jgi:branched-chain amino acid transport system permease protein
MVEALATYYAGLFWTPVIIFSVMVVVMLVRPEGLVAIRTTHR